MLLATDKEESRRDYLKLAQIHTAIQKREHEQRRQMVIKNILEKQGDISYKIPATDYLKTFKPDLIGCSALHSAFSAGNIHIFNDILQKSVDFTIEYNGMSIIHRAVEENFDEYESSKLVQRFRQYTNANFTTEDINSFIIMSKTIEQKNMNESDNWRLRRPLDNPFVQSILSAQIERANPVNPSSKNGISHFHAACMANNCKAVKFFLENGADVNQSVNINSAIYSGCKPIHFAVRCSGLETVEQLLKYQVNVIDKDGQGKTPLQILMDHNIKIREWLNINRTLPYDESITDYVKNQKIIHLLIEYLNKSATNTDSLCLYAACTLQSTATTEILLTNSNINFINTESDMWPGYTALHVAAFCNTEIAKILLKYGADIEAKDKNGITALDILITKANIKDLHLILRTKDEWKNIVLSDGNTLLLDLVSSMDNLSSFEDFLSTRDINIYVPVDSALWPGCTVLHLVVMFSESAKVQEFLKNATDSKLINYNIQLENCCQEQTEIQQGKVLACLRRNANVCMQDVHGRTAIHLAFRQRNINVVKLLSEHLNCNVENLIDEDNLSLLHIFCAAGCKELVEKLLPSKNINTAILASFHWDCKFYNSYDVFKTVGSTPLHVALLEENLDIVKLLVSAGADVNAKDVDNLTAVHRIFALRNIWKIGNDMFNWSDLRRSLMMFESVEMYRYRNAMTNFKDISDVLLSSATSKQSIESTFSIHRRQSDETNQSYSFESGERLLEQGLDLLAKQHNGGIWLFDKLKYPYRDDIRFIVTLLRQDEIMRKRLKEEFGWTTLHVASSLFNVDLAKEALAANTDVNAKTFNDSPIYPGCTPLHILMMSLDGRRSYSESKEDYESVLHILLDNGADVTSIDLNNDTPLHRSDYSRFWTSRSFKDSIYTELLLEHIKNFEVNSVNDKGISSFHLACLKHNYRAVAEFLKHGVDVNLPVDFFAFDAMDMDEFAGFTPLHMAVKELPKSSNAESSIAIVELLLSYGADVHLVDAFGDSPLHIAAAADAPNDKLLELIIRAGADVNAENLSGKTALERLLESRKASRKEIEVFLRRGCRLNSFNPLSQVGLMALLIRCKLDQQVQKSIDMAMNCPSVNDIDEMGRTAVHNIVTTNEFPDADGVDVIDYLMSYGGDIDRQDRLGRTALHIAAQFRNYGAVRGLISSGADINIVDANGQTAFAYALDPETCLVDLTLDFNVSVNKHLVIDVFAEYVHNMLFRGTYVNDINKQAQTRAINDFDVRINEISSSFETIRNENIGSTCLKVDDFMSETGAVVSYPKKSQAERNEIDQFFTSTINEDRFYEWRFLCKLQYRKSLARAQLVQLAKDTFNVIIDFPLPYLCFDVIQQFLSNADLKNLIATEKNLLCE